MPGKFILQVFSHRAHHFASFSLLCAHDTHPHSSRTLVRPSLPSGQGLNYAVGPFLADDSPPQSDPFLKEYMSKLDTPDIVSKCGFFDGTGKYKPFVPRHLCARYDDEEMLFGTMTCASGPPREVGKEDTLGREAKYYQMLGYAYVTLLEHKAYVDVCMQPGDSKILHGGYLLEPVRAEMKKRGIFKINFSDVMDTGSTRKNWKKHWKNWDAKPVGQRGETNNDLVKRFAARADAVEAMKHKFELEKLLIAKREANDREEERSRKEKERSRKEKERLEALLQLQQENTEQKLRTEQQIAHMQERMENTNRNIEEFKAGTKRNMRKLESNTERTLAAAEQMKAGHQLVRQMKIEMDDMNTENAVGINDLRNKTTRIEMELVNNNAKNRADIDKLNSDVSKLDNRYIITKEKFLEQYLVVDNKDKFDVIFDGLNILFFGNPSKKKLKAMGKPPTPYPRQLVAAVNHAKILGLRYLVIAKSFIETTCEDIDTMKALDAMGENIKYVDAGEEDYFSKVEDDPVVLRMAISHRAAIVSNDNFKEWFTSPKVNRLELGYGLVPYTFIHGKIEMLVKYYNTDASLRLAEHGKCPLFLMVQQKPRYKRTFLMGHTPQPASILLLLHPPPKVCL